MATHDYVIANGTGAAVRSDLNNALAAIVSNNSSSTEPGTRYAYQFWADTNNNVLKIRNSSNDGWITLRELDGTMLIEDGSGANPGLAFASDTNSGLFGGSDVVGFSTGGTQRFKLTNTEAVVNEVSNDYDFRVESNGNTHMLYIDAGNDRVGIGTASPITKLDVNGNVRFGDGGGFDMNINGTRHQFSIGGSEKMRLDSSGRLMVGTTSPGPASGEQLTIADSANAGITIRSGTNAGGTILFEDSAQDRGEIQYSHNGDYMRFKTAGSETMRIDSSGRLLVGKTDTGDNDNGAELKDGVNNYAVVAVATETPPVMINRKGNDGQLIQFRQDNTQEGNISVSGSTVSLQGAHLTRWSQLAGGAERTQILRGSVLSNLDEMCEWGEEDNEQLNRMKVSDIEGDPNVAGVFQDWDDDDDTYTNDFNCAMTGDFVIRIAQGTTVARGDLLMSAGDGTAKPQDDDIVRSKTIAKVTSTTVSTTYSDGSYCVPCVLMAC